MPTIDLNCDLGESFGAYRIGNDSQLIPLVSSVNIACGFHAGSPTVMRETVQAAAAAGVAIGAHPGLPDLEGFGRRLMQLSRQQVYDITLYQVAALAGVAHSLAAPLHHVKPHGALYNQAAVNREWAEAICEAVAAFDPGLLLYALAGSELVKAARCHGLVSVEEVFADRSYQDDGSLTPRSHSRALLSDQRQARDQVLRMVEEGVVHSLEGKVVPIKAETVCLHGDGEHALTFARHLRQELRQRGVAIVAPVAQVVASQRKQPV